LGELLIFRLELMKSLLNFRRAKKRWTLNKQSSELLISRGTILDRNNKNLALSVVVKSFFADPKKIKSPTRVARKLSRILRISRYKLSKLLQKDTHFVWLKREVSDKAAKKIQALNIPGVYWRKESKRVYPHRKLAKTVIGISGHDGIGLEGIEKKYDQFLQTSDSNNQPGIRDALGRLLLFKDYEREWFDGYQVHTSIDLRIQRILEAELSKTLKEKKAKSAQGIMLNPKTGEILAMASIEGKRKEKNPLRNRSISDIYEPGSTFKIILAAAAFEHLGLSPSSQIFGENGSLRVGRHTIREYARKKYQWLSLQELLEVSSNVASAKLGLRIGAKKFNSTIQKFGFGTKSGIDLPGEASGIIRKASSWKPIELANISFGQGIAITPLQMISAVAAIANGGYLVKPYLVSKVSPIHSHKKSKEKEADQLAYEVTPEKKEIISAKYARQLTNMLIHVTDIGSTGAGGAVKGYKVAGKTGTSQKLVEKTNSKGKTYKTYSSEHSIVSFVGYVPAYDPAFVLLVLYDDPEGRATGGKIAAPTFKRVASKTLALLGIPPQKVVAPNKKSLAKKKLVKEGTHYVGRSFQDVLREVRNLPPEQRAQIDLIGYGTAVREEKTENDKIKVFFE